MLSCGRTGAAEAEGAKRAQTARKAAKRAPGTMLILRRVGGAVWGLADMGESILRGVSTINGFVKPSEQVLKAFWRLDAATTQPSPFVP
jgi:hypothetical protein